MRQTFTKKTKSKKGQAENRGSGQANGVETGRIRNTYDRQDDGKKDNNPATDKRKSGTIYRGENRCTTWKQVYHMRQ